MSQSLLQRLASLCQPDHPGLPIHQILSDIGPALQNQTILALNAPPGAGKTTMVPLYLLWQALSQPDHWCADKLIIMLEPRRIAAKEAASFMAQLLGEKTGETIGYHIRFDRKKSDKTRILIVTEGILTAYLQQDPALEEAACLLFDEYHERHLQTDLGFALAQDCQEGLRPDLRLILMSATLDHATIAEALPDLDFLKSEGRSFPVETCYLPPKPTDRLDQQIKMALSNLATRPNEAQKDILIFLPGEAEIRQCQKSLADWSETTADLICPLYGSAAPAIQKQALSPAPAGQRKIILATNIAESSVTIDGVAVVIDTGLTRKPHYDLARGISHLQTRKISRAAADQRRGRAGRQQPGLCYRLWAEGQNRTFPAFDPPEITETDLAPLALQLSLWGCYHWQDLAWMTPPPQTSMDQAYQLLRYLDILDQDRHLTPHGQIVARLSAHPRIGHMLVKAQQAGSGDRACRVAALLEGRDLFLAHSDGRRETNLQAQLDYLEQPEAPHPPLHKASVAQTKQLIKSLQQQLKSLPRSTALDDLYSLGSLIALAYPDRLAQARDHADLGTGQTAQRQKHKPTRQHRPVRAYLLRDGLGASLAADHPLSQSDYLAIAHLNGQAGNLTIRSAAPIHRDEIDDLFADHIQIQQVARWHRQRDMLQSREETQLGRLVLTHKSVPTPTPESQQAAIIGRIRELGATCLPWQDETRQWQARLQFCVSHYVPEEDREFWPTVSDTHLISQLEEWLSPFLSNIRKRADFDKIDLASALLSLLDWEQQQFLQKYCPDKIKLSNGREARLDYLVDDGPDLPIRLQHLFGVTDTPTLPAYGTIAPHPIRIRLLSPANRPVQTTRDLPYFWENSYQEVRKEMRGRYPKHNWPENPLKTD